mmetsp:Transcript_34507/g.78775  ORF Transcript_34507/g.78775 Transcript_34507/m.78775 type:complete len:310 (-) Transcript_34507:198-1127(-)
MSFPAEAPSSSQSTPQSRGRFSVFRGVLRRFGRRDRDRGSASRTDGSARSGESLSTLSPGQRPDARAYPWQLPPSEGSGQARQQRQTEGVISQLQFAREARNLEIALQRSLEESGQTAPPSRRDGVAGGRDGDGQDRVVMRDAQGRPIGSRGRNRAIAHVLGSGAGGLADEDRLVAQILASSLRADGPDGRTFHGDASSSSGARAHHAAMRGLVGLGEDGGGGDRSLQEVIEQSKRAHLLGELPHEKFNPEQHKDLNECELCLQEYVAGEELLRLPCMHLFHCNCVTPWLQKSYTCPVCQTDISQVMGL